MRIRAALLASCLSFAALAALAPAPVHAATTVCGGTAPVATTCWSSSTIDTTSFTIGARSTQTFTGYVIVRFGTGTGSASFTAYFVAGRFVSQSTPTVSGGFQVGQPYHLEGDGVGSGGWQVFSTA